MSAWKWRGFRKDAVNKPEIPVNSGQPLLQFKRVSGLVGLGGANVHFFGTELVGGGGP